MDLSAENPVQLTCGQGWSPPGHTMQVSCRAVSVTATGQYTSEPLRTAATEKTGTQAPPHSGDRARRTL